MKRLILISILLLSLAGCTEQERAKNFGGKTATTLPKGQKLVVVTWKDDDLWLLTRPMKSEDSIETYTFQEQSSFGVWQGTVTITEQK